MTRVRLTIGRLMIAIAWVAGLLTAFRLLGERMGSMLAASLTTGWIAWRVARGRPRLAAGGMVTAAIAWQLAVAVLAPAFDLNLFVAGLTLLFLGCPILLGFGLAWMQANQDESPLRGVLLGSGLALLLALYLPTLFWVILIASS